MKTTNNELTAHQQFDAVRSITIMVSDISELSRVVDQTDLDRDQVFLKTFRDLSSDIVESHGGILKETNDSTLVSIFGIDTMHEDDPIIAVKASREIHKLADILIGKSESVYKKQYIVKTGIDSGFVNLPVQKLLSEELDSLKDIIESASLLCECAELGSIVIGQNPYHNVSRYYELEDITPGIPKDVGVKERIFKVIDERSRPFRIRREKGYRSEFIARRFELKQLYNAREDLKNGNGGFVEVSGEAGIGKTRLINEFKNSIDLDKVNWIEGYCFSYFVNYPFILFLNLLSDIFSIKEGDSKSTIRMKIEGVINGLVDEPQEIIPHIYSLYSIRCEDPGATEPTLFKLNLFESVHKLLIAYSKDKPLIIAFEDLQWADRSSIDLIRYLISKNGHISSILFILSHRNEFSLLTVRQSLERSVNYRDINLKNLSDEDSRVMLESMLQSEWLPKELLKLVMTTGEGNPFYIEEIINSLIESRKLSKKGNEWIALPDIGSSVLTKDIKELVISRLDHLNLSSKQILYEASVIGRVFNPSILEKITAIPEKVEDSLRHLEFLNLIESFGFSEDEDFIFKHAIIYDVTYSSIPQETRQSLHRKIGKYYENLYSENLDLHLDLIAYHYSESDDYEKAVYFCMMAGEKSYYNASLYEAGEYYQKVVEFIRRAPESEILEDTLLVSLHRIFDCLKMTNPAVVLEHLQLMLKIYERRGDAFNTLITKGLMISAYAGSNRWREGGKLGEELISSQDKGSLIWAILLIPTAMSILSLGELERTFNYAVQSIEVIKDQDPWLLASAYLCAYSSSSWMGNISDSLSYADLSIELCKKNKQLIDMEAFSYLYQGFSYLFQGEYVLAKESLYKSREIEEELGGGYYYLSAFRYFVSGLMYNELGDWENLKIEADELVNLQRHIDGSLLHFADIYYGCIESQKGNNEVALQHMKNGINEFESLKLGIVLPKAYRFLGELYKKMDEIDKAFEAIQDSLMWAERTDQKTEIIASICDKALLLAHREDWDGAFDELSKSEALSEELELIPSKANVMEAWGIFYSLKANRFPKERSKLIAKAKEYYNLSLNLWKEIDNFYRVERMEKGLDK